MYKQTALFARFVLVSFSFYFMLAACTPDNELYPQSPAGQIAESENLVIPASVELPANEPAGNTRVATYYAKGVQKYMARVKATDPTAFEWAFVGPDAKLYDVSNTKVGSHGVGPHWTLTPADSIFAQHFAPARTAPSPDPNSIDWLLLMTKTGTTPTGVFADVDYIQRIATEGGKAPAEAPTSIKETVDVPYSAIYRFSKKNP
jgi:hypothetical protein